MRPEKLSKLVLHALEEMKGQAVTCLQVDKLTSITDYMVIVTGTSSTHVKALADEVISQTKQAGLNIIGVEGQSHAEWILVDIGSVIVHIMLAPVRALYNLEELWDFNPDDFDENPVKTS